MEPEVQIRSLHSVAEMDAVVALQRVYWGDDMSALVPSHMLLSIVRYGGHVHGAYIGDELVGALVGFLGARIDADDTHSAARNLLVMSKRMIVLPEYRSRRIGELLKLAQRDFAIRHGIELVTWTFDPLLARNAYLNLHKLGVVIQHYTPDYFGTDLHNPALASDRVTADWWVSHPNTVQRVKTRPPAAKWSELMARGAEQVHVPVAGSVWIAPGDLQHVESDTVLLEIPNDFISLDSAVPDLGAAWRTHVRKAFQALLTAGYTAVDFTRCEGPERRDTTAYIFERNHHDYDFTPSN